MKYSILSLNSDKMANADHFVVGPEEEVQLNRLQNIAQHPRISEVYSSISITTGFEHVKVQI